MNKLTLGLGLSLLLCGCASVEMVKYTVTSFPEVTLESPEAGKPNVKLVAGSDEISPIVDAVKTEFVKSGAFDVVEEDADYWFVFNGSEAYADGGSHQKFNVVKKEASTGGRDAIEPMSLNLASATKIVNVSVYQARILAPVTYFEVPLYAGDCGEGAARAAGDYTKAFTDEVVERVNDAFLTQKKDVEIPVALTADGGLRKSFAAGDYKKFNDAYSRLVGPKGFDLTAFCETVRKGEYKGSDVEQKLSNYSLMLLVKESQTTSPAELAKIRDEQMKVLEFSSGKGLAEAVPVALARLEYKLANSGN